MTTQAAPRGRVAVRLLMLTLLLLVFEGALAGPASAHATLLTTSPGDGSVVADAPTTVSLTYDEAVGLQLGAVRVLAPDGSRVDSGEVTSADDGRTVTVGLTGDLPRGTYTILWRVISEDTHSIFGASTFSIGAPSATTVDTDQSAGQVAAVGLDVARGLVYAGLLVLLGGLWFLARFWPPGRSDRRAVRVLVIGWGLAVLGTVAGLVLQGPSAAGRPVTDLFDPTLLVGVLQTRFGLCALVRLVLLVALLVLVIRPARTARGFGPLTAVLGAGTLATVSWAGHAGAGPLVALALPLDVAHLAAAAAWIGGLVMLAGVALARTTPAAAGSPVARPVPGELLPRWSRWATAAVLVLIATGTFASWREIREWYALVDTEYGWLLLGKLAVVLLILALAAVARSRVRRSFTPRPPAAPPGPGTPTPASGGAGTVLVAAPLVGAPAASSTAPEVTRLRRAVLIEAGLGAVVVAVTAVLASTVPARDSYSPPVTLAATVAAPSGTTLAAELTVAPARAGTTGVRVVYTGAGGRPVDVLAARVRWIKDGDVIPIDLVRSGPGRYTADRVTVPEPGRWSLELTTKTSDIDSTTTVLAVDLR